MELQVLIKVNEKLYLRNPAESELGRKIVHHSVELIHTIGFESFTFKKTGGGYWYHRSRHIPVLQQ